jgi:hypothetical protein
MTNLRESGSPAFDFVDTACCWFGSAEKNALLRFPSLALNAFSGDLAAFNPRIGALDRPVVIDLCQKKGRTPVAERFDDFDVCSSVNTINSQVSTSDRLLSSLADEYRSLPRRAGREIKQQREDDCATSFDLTFDGVDSSIP